LKKSKGMALLTVLLLTTLMVLMAVSMVFISTNNLYLFGTQENKKQALRAAEAGIEYAIYMLNNDPSWGLIRPLSFPKDGISLPVCNKDNSIEEEITINKATFKISFNTGEGKYCSTNNLFSPNPSDDTPPYTAKIISIGEYGSVKKVMRAFLARSDFYPYNLNSEGLIVIGEGSYIIKGNDPNDTNPPGGIYSGWKAKEGEAEVTGIMSSSSDITSYGGLLIAMGKIQGIPSTFDGALKSNMPQSLNIGKINVEEILNRAKAGEYTSGAPINTISPGFVQIIDIPPTASYPGAYPGMIKRSKLDVFDSTGFFNNIIFDTNSGMLKLKNDIYITGDRSNLNTEESRFKILLDLVSPSLQPDVFFLYRRPEAIIREVYVFKDILHGFVLSEFGGTKWIIKLDLNNHTIYSDSHLILGVQLVGKGKIISYGKINCLLGVNSNDVILISEDDLQAEVAEDSETSYNTGFYHATDDLTIKPISAGSVLLAGAIDGVTPEITSRTYNAGFQFYFQTPPRNTTVVGRYEPAPDHDDPNDFWMTDYKGEGIIINKINTPEGDKLVAEGNGGDFEFCIEYDNNRKINLKDKKIEIIQIDKYNYTVNILDTSGNILEPTDFDPGFTHAKLEIFGIQIFRDFYKKHGSYTINMKATIASFNKYRNTNPLHEENQSKLDIGGSIILEQNPDYISDIVNLERTSFRVRKLSCCEIE